MGNWFLKSLGDAMLAAVEQEQVRELLSAAYENAGGPSEMAVFMRHESEGHLHCEVKVYFSPMSAVVAREVGAVPCGKPSPEGLSLLAGSEDSWQALFAETDR